MNFRDTIKMHRLNTMRHRRECLRRQAAAKDAPPVSDPLDAEVSRADQA